MAAEQHELIPSLTGVYGTSGLYLRGSPTAPRELSGNMVHRMCSAGLDAGRLVGDFGAVPTQLPFADDSFSLCYVLHVFESIQDRETLARELCRVLQPEGTLIVVALNPVSAWCLRWYGRGPEPVAAGRMVRTLEGASLSVVRQRPVGPAWPTWATVQRRVGRDGGVDLLGAVRAGYAVFARKRRVAMTPLPSPRAVPALSPHARAG
ncbi:MAG TPA: methyltransferase domain-containing protein [Xanthomonadaceae bacterium]|nr:methyltransferase domain-containing protein [Xanthomonadaceae bacterium]